MTDHKRSGEPAGMVGQAQKIAAAVAQRLLVRDKVSNALGIRLIEVGPGCARLSMVVRADMLNGHGTCHGGIVFSLADSAFALACNSYNVTTVASAASIDFLAPAKVGDELTAAVRELWRSKRNGLYEIDVCNQSGERVAVFRGRSYSIGGEIIEEGDAEGP